MSSQADTDRNGHGRASRLYPAIRLGGQHRFADGSQHISCAGIHHHDGALVGAAELQVPFQDLRDPRREADIDSRAHATVLIPYLPDSGIIRLMAISYEGYERTVIAADQR